MGAVQSFLVDGLGQLSPGIANVSSGGDGPPFVVGLSTGEVAVVNYGSGTGRVIPTRDEVFFGDNAPIVTFPPPVNGSSHPHMVLEHNGEILIPDLVRLFPPIHDTTFRLLLVRVLTQFGDLHGTKTLIVTKFRVLFLSLKVVDLDILQYMVRANSSNKKLETDVLGTVEDRLYTLHELSSTLTVQRIPGPPNATVPIIASVSITPPNPPAGAKFAAAEILIPPTSPAFPIPYIYVSNRNTGNLDPRGDSIAIFQHVNKDRRDEGLQLIQQVYTGLDQIRGMEFGPDPYEFLAASGFQGSAGVLILRRIDEGRNLEIVARNLDVPTRTSFVWL